MRFLVDAQLPPDLARWLAAQGHEAEHVSDCSLARAANPAVWDYAASVDGIIVTKDEEFARRKVLDRQGPRVVCGSGCPTRGGASSSHGLRGCCRACCRRWNAVRR